MGDVAGIEEGNESGEGVGVDIEKRGGGGERKKGEEEKEVFHDSIVLKAQLKSFPDVIIHFQQQTPNSLKLDYIIST